MCGIVGAAAQRNVTSILMEGLRRLEYRGYDSAGIAVIDAQHEVKRLRVLGKVAALRDALKKNPLQGHIGIAHTRWATHGKPSEMNAHPHFSKNQQIGVVHNGIIENHDELRNKLIKLGYQFESETDTEVIGHLIHHHLQQSNDIKTAIFQATQELRGAYALGIISNQHPKSVFGVRNGSPLVVGIGIDENFIASDTHALLPVTQRFIYLENGDSVMIEGDHYEIYDKSHQKIDRDIHEVSASQESASKGTFRHFMQKEIFDQPNSLTDTIDGHIFNDNVMVQSFGVAAPEIFKTIKRVVMVACGTSFHAALVARTWLESFGIPCQVEIASENRYRSYIVEAHSLFVVISQSGETADTLAALHRAKKANFAATLTISNVAHSSMVRETDLTFLTRAGMEIGVAATKTFTAQLTALLMLSVTLGQYHQLKAENVKQISREILQLPSLVEETLKLDKKIQSLAKQFIDAKHALFLGRGELYPIAMEGALKLKEISYIHAESYPAGELKHGPLALVDDTIPIIVVAPKNALFEKIESNIEEVQARGGHVYVFSDEQEKWKSRNGNLTLIPMPKVPEILAPIVYTIPLQLLAYYIAVLKGTDVDQPRNLAKSVTVE